MRYQLYAMPRYEYETDRLYEESNRICELATQASMLQDENRKWYIRDTLRDKTISSEQFWKILRNT